MTVVIVDNYDSFTFNLADYVARCDAKPLVLKNNVELDEVIAASPTHVILSPGPGRASDPEAYGCCVDVLDHFTTKRVPVLGVCLGHQIIAHHLGADLVATNVVRHGWISDIDFNPDARLFIGMEAPFTAMRYHSWVVDAATLPDSLSPVAQSHEDRHLMAFEHKGLPLFGVQFHPESVGSTQGLPLLRNFLNL